MLWDLCGQDSEEFTLSATDPLPNAHHPCRLTIFAFLWASQAVEHQEFFAGSLRVNSFSGWTLTILAMATLLWPGSLPLFTGMLAISVVNNVSFWPHVSNHILLESIINVTILLAIARTYAFRRTTEVSTREAIFHRFDSVIRAMLVLLYYFAFISKLNEGFLDPDVSCVATMYRNLSSKLAFLPDGSWTPVMTIWLTLFVEAAIPILLTFRRTRSFAIFLGLPFHYLLGMVGHRTFSAEIYALYGLFCMESLVYWVAGAQRFIQERVTKQRRHLFPKLVRVAVLAYSVLVITELTLKSAPVSRAAQAAWALWSLALAVVYVWAIVSSRASRADSSDLSGRPGPGMLWLMFVVILLNGSTQYLGLKTQTNFTMYSNLRTEGGVNNHLFMPALHPFSYQDDLVDVLESDLPALQKYVDDDLWITHFEFQRIVSETTRDFQVKYRRGDEERRFQLRQGVNTDPALYRKHPLWQAKLLYFRPVDKAENPRCQH